VSAPPPDPAPDGPSGPRGLIDNLIIIGFVAGMLILGVWLFNAIGASQKAQECLESGRRSCRIIETR
jgi:hypothetical protein